MPRSVYFSPTSIRSTAKHVLSTIKRGVVSLWNRVKAILRQVFPGLFEKVPHVQDAGVRLSGARVTDASRVGPNIYVPDVPEPLQAADAVEESDAGEYFSANESYPSEASTLSPVESPVLGAANSSKVDEEEVRHRPLSEDAGNSTTTCTAVLPKGATGSSVEQEDSKVKEEGRLGDSTLKREEATGTASVGAHSARPSERTQQLMQKLQERYDAFENKCVELEKKIIELARNNKKLLDSELYEFYISRMDVQMLRHNKLINAVSYNFELLCKTCSSILQNDAIERDAYTQKALNIIKSDQVKPLIEDVMKRAEDIVDQEEGNAPREPRTPHFKKITIPEEQFMAVKIEDIDMADKYPGYLSKKDRLHCIVFYTICKLQNSTIAFPKELGALEIFN